MLYTPEVWLWVRHAPFVTKVTNVTVNSGLMSLAPMNEESAWHGEENLGEDKSNLRVGVALRV